MRAIVNVAPDRLEWTELAIPEPQTGQVRIRTAACGICATDLHMISGWDRITYPAIPGHEWSGIVEAVGPGVDAEWIGGRCVGENVLSDGGEIGFEHPGGYAEYFVTEAEKLRFLPDGFSLVEAVLIEPLAVCIRGIRRLRLENRSSAVIFGDGPIGLLMLWLLRHNHVERILIVGGRGTRLKLAEEIGADITLNYHRRPGDLLTEICGEFPSGFANVIEATGSEFAFQTGIDVAQKRGKILVIGEYGKASVYLPANQMLLNELEIIGSNASEGAWDDALQLATEKAVPLSKLISCAVPAGEFNKGVNLARNSREIIKIVLKWLDNATS